MQKQQEEQVFSHPSQAVLEAGLACDDPECGGQYVKKKRDITMKRRSGPIVIRDSEYWECESCGGFVTSLEEEQRIRAYVRSETSYTGRLTVRLSPELHRLLSLEAEHNRRSLNNELAYRLEQSFKENDVTRESD